MLLFTEVKRKREFAEVIGFASAKSASQ